MEGSKKLFLLDAYALIYRGYYAFIKNPRINSKGTDTSAILGFMNSLLEIIRTQKPDYLAVAFDKGGSITRSEMFTEYKSNRDKTPEPIILAIPYIKDILTAMKIPILEKEGYEADDVIGTVAKDAEDKNFKVYMVTPDKDFAQLVSENIYLCKPARMGNSMEIWGVDEVKDKFEIDNPEQVIDYLGMMGDSVDNIPGLPGVGDKTAKKFIKQYGSLENLLQNAHEITGKLGEKISNNKDLGVLSKKLARIILDVPIDYNLNDFELSKPDNTAVFEVFDELEFRRIKETFYKIFGLEKSEKKDPKKEYIQGDLFGNNVVDDSKLNLNKSKSYYQRIESSDELQYFTKKLLQQKIVAFDTETEGLNSLETEIVGISFSWESGKGFYLPIKKDKTIQLEYFNILRPFFNNKEIIKVGHNIKFDIKVLFKYDVVVSEPIYDTMVAHYLINPDMRHNLDTLSESYLNYSPISIESLIGKKGKNQKSMRDIPIDEVTNYASEDADLSLQLKYIFDKELESNGVKDIFLEIETPIINVLSDMEKEGINIDSAYLNQLEKEFEKDLNKLKKDIYNQSGEEFNLNSPKQLGDILFDKLKLVSKPKKTKTGQYSTSEEVLSSLADDHEIIRSILEWRSLDKLQNTYVKSLPNEVSVRTNKIHTKFNQTVTTTGRLSSNNPNLQNIPIRTKNGQKIRKAFIPRNNDYVLMAADYSQIELRVIASISKDQNMIDAFINNQDIHTITASKIYNIKPDEVTREQRGNAKTVNFGIIYGVSAFGLSQQTNLSRSESKVMIESYFENYPGLKSYMSNQIDFARTKGYVETIMGRRRYLQNINSQNNMIRSGAERNAINAPIQGSAADIIKIAMIRIHNKFKKQSLKSRMLLQVHDELVFDVFSQEKELVQEIVKNTMESAVKLDVPLKVDLDFGKNWLEAH
ncbi:MAG: DNA polymerase I [Flavobacteriales bacterium]|nr:DNA polymerase I [Flavobacteriales bacterium]